MSEWKDRLMKSRTDDEEFHHAVEGLEKRREASRAMLKALKELREWDALQGYWVAPCFDHMRTAIAQAEKAGITTGEDKHD